MDELTSQIDLLLQKRHEVYPIRDYHYFESIDKISSLSTQLLNKVQVLKSGWRPDPKLVDTVKDFIDNPVFICGGMKSGTTLMTQLLDNHPSLVVMPGDSTLYTNFNDYSDTFDELSNHWIQRMINPSGKLPFWFLGKDLKAYQDFLLYLQYFLKLPYDTFQAVVASVFCANPNRSASPQYWVEKTPENELKASALKKLYPNAKFIHVLRHPLVNVTSIKKMNLLKGQKFRAFNYSIHLKRLLKNGVENLRSIGSKTYKFSKYENVISKPEEELRSIAKHLGITFTESLLVPTENGVEGIANSMYKENMVIGEVSTQGINQKWQNELTKKEKIYTVTTLSDLASKLGFENWSNESVQRYNKPFSTKALIITLTSTLAEIKKQLFK